MYRNIYSRANSWEVSEHVRVSATIVVTNNSLKTVPIFYAKFYVINWSICQRNIIEK